MKSLNAKRLALAALTLAALCASSMWATGTGAQSGSHKFWRLVAMMGAEGYDVESSGGRVVGMRALRLDGSWSDLRPQAPPDDGTAPRFKCHDLHEVAHCYEDDENQMSVCVCVRVDTIAIGPGPVAGPVINSWGFVKQTSR